MSPKALSSVSRPMDVSASASESRVLVSVSDGLTNTSASESKVSVSIPDS